MSLTIFPAYSVPFFLAAGGLGLFVIPWLIRLPALALALLLASLAIGQTVRLPLPGQGGGLLVSDIAVVIVLVAALIRLRARRSQKLPVTSYELLVTFFLLWSLFTLAINAPELGAHNAAIAAAYWVRLATHLLLLPALMVLLTDAACAAVVRRGLLVVTVALALIGLFQLVLAPDLAALVPHGGWDPHSGRLVGSWLDPNFLGAYFALVLPFVASRLLPGIAAAARRRHAWLVGTLGLAGASLVLTQSRSAFVALAAAMLVFSPFLISRLAMSATLARRSGGPTRRIAVASATLLLVVGLGLGGFIMRDRLSGLVQFDDTVTLRARALTAVWPLAEQHAWLGVGYNAYQFAAERARLISNFTIHSRAGADNSLLTLWVTVGLPGLLLFLAPWAAIAQRLLRAIMRSGSASAAGALTSLTVLFIHSQFVNSFLYTHLLITLALIVTLALVPSARTAAHADEHRTLSSPYEGEVPRACRGAEGSLGAQ